LEVVGEAAAGRAVLHVSVVVVVVAFGVEIFQMGLVVASG